MANTISDARLQTFYIAYYGRAADTAGLSYWSSVANSAVSAGGLAGNESAVVQNLGAATQTEFVAVYGSNPDTPTFIDSVYNNLFGHVADVAGRNYWNDTYNTMIAGGSSANAARSVLVTYIVDGAKDADVAAIPAKVSYATSFTAALDTDAEKTAFSDLNNTTGLETARTAMRSVVDPATSETAKASINTVAASIVTSATVTTPTSHDFALTPGADTGTAFTGTMANDSFTGTYDAVVTDTFNDTDILNGGGGTDTLDITHHLDVDITPPDALWTGIRGIEKIAIHTSGDGAQTITTGAMFEAAFHGNGVTGVDLTTTTTTGAGAITISMPSFGGTATLTPTSVAGAQTIITGSGDATVNATSGAGALTIKGVGLATASATTTGNGAQTIGDAEGNGAHLVTVTATSNSGAQTITSTSASAVTVTATSTSGPQTIDTGTGADSVTTEAATGTNNTITTNAGNDTIEAGLGTDLITGGLGADSMIGGGGADTFMFGADGSIIGTSMDIITDFNTAGADVLNFGATTTVLAADASALVAGANVQISAGGLITFHASDNTLALKIIAVQADSELDTAGTVAMFVDGANTYVYYAGTAPGNADDQLIQLTGINTLVTITGGTTTVIV